MVKTIKELRRLDPSQLDNELQKHRKDLMDMKSMLSSGGSIDDPGKVKEIKRTIARIMTMQREEELGINQ